MTEARGPHPQPLPSAMERGARCARTPLLHCGGEGAGGGALSHPSLDPAGRLQPLWRRQVAGGRGERAGCARPRRPHPGPRLRRYRPSTFHPRVRRVRADGRTALAPRTGQKLVHLARLALTATAGADVCLANYLTTSYVAVASKWLRGDRAILAYNVRGYEPLSHGLNADASLPSRLMRAGLAWLSYRLPLQKICTTDWLREQTGDPSAYVVGHGIDLTVFRPAPERVDGRAHRDRHHRAPRRGKGVPRLSARGRAVSRLDLPIEFRIAAPDAVELPTRFPSTVEHPQAGARNVGVLRTLRHIRLFVSRRRVRAAGPGSRWRSAARSSQPTQAGCVSSLSTTRTALVPPRLTRRPGGRDSPPRARPVAPDRSAAPA